MKTVIFILGVTLVLGANAAVSNSGEVDGFVSQEEFDQLFNDVMSSNFGFDPKCKLCDEVMRKVRKEVGRESSREHIKDALDRACTIIPIKKYRAKCRESAKGEKGDRIVDMLVKEETSKAICIYMGFC